MKDLAAPSDGSRSLLPSNSTRDDKYNKPLMSDAVQQPTTTSTQGDIVGAGKATGQGWFYTNTVKDHFFHPKNFMEDGQEESYKDAAMGMVGSPACGDAMKIWIKVDEATQRITDLKWKTFGCASAIASTSMMSVIVTEAGGVTLEDARKLRPQDIMMRLGGLPARKVHCSVLGDKALVGGAPGHHRRYPGALCERDRSDLNRAEQARLGGGLGAGPGAGFGEPFDTLGRTPHGYRTRKEDE